MKNLNEDSRIQISDHILPSSANLLGVCFLIFSLARSSAVHENTVLDELTVLAIFTFLFSSVLSYLSLRSNKRNNSFEKIADKVFISGLFILAISSLIVMFEII